MWWPSGRLQMTAKKTSGFTRKCLKFMIIADQLMKFLRDRRKGTVNAWMGTRRKTSRPRRDRDAHLPRPRPWLHQPRRDRDETLKFWDETETWRLSRDVIETWNNCGNVTTKRVFQCWKLSNEYLKLLDKHNCGPRDNTYKIRRYVYYNFVLQTGV